MTCILLFQTFIGTVLLEAFSMRRRYFWKIQIIFHFNANILCLVPQQICISVIAHQGILKPAVITLFGLV